MTPFRLARALVAAVQPSGVILEPCAGTGNFVRALKLFGTVLTCEIDHGHDFLHWTQHVDRIVGNPPWSKFRAFLAHALTVADRIAFIASINHLWTRHRRELVREAGFGIEKIIEFDAPKEWKAPGFQLGMIVLTSGWSGPCTIEPLVRPGTHALPDALLNAPSRPLAAPGAPR